MKTWHPFSVIPMVCSNWADRDLSFVTAVHPSCRILTSFLPALTMGSIVKNMPGLRVGPCLGLP